MLQSITQLIDIVKNDLLEKNDTTFKGVKTGFIDLDNLIGGMENEEIIVLGGRSGMGKTTLALSILRHAALHQSKNCIYFSADLRSQQLLERLLRIEAHIEGSKRIDEKNKETFIRAIDTYRTAHVFIDDTFQLNINNMMDICKSLQGKEQVDLIILDYLQMIESTNVSTRCDGIYDIMRKLKSLARDLNSSILVLSQVRTQVDRRINKRPMLSDLRFATDIEEIADKVLLMYREDYYSPKCEYKDVTEIIVAKNNKGHCSTVEIAFLPNYPYFANFYKPNDN